jgi:hypothetical protein
MVFLAKFFERCHMAAELIGPCASIKNICPLNEGEIYRRGKCDWDGCPKVIALRNVQGDECDPLLRDRDANLASAKK